VEYLNLIKPCDEAGLDWTHWLKPCIHLWML